MKEGFPLTARGKSITDRTVEVILKNPFYTGKMRERGELQPHKYQKLISEDLFNKVQSIIHKHHKSPVQYAGKEFLFKWLIICKNCNGTVTGDIKKNKYVYYVCHNSKKICKKRWVKEELFLTEIFNCFDQIQLTDSQIKDIISFIKKEEAQEQEFFITRHRILNEQLQLVKDRTSKLIDMHIDGRLDSETYHYKLDEYKKEQSRIVVDISSCSIDNKNEIICA